MGRQAAFSPTGHDHCHFLRVRPKKPLQFSHGKSARKIVDAAIAFGLAEDRDQAGWIQCTAIDQPLQTWVAWSDWSGLIVSA